MEPPLIVQEVALPGAQFNADAVPDDRCAQHGKVVHCLRGEGSKAILAERDEWELPGGKLEVGEEPAECVVRQIAEETGWSVASGPLLDVWMYHVLPGRHVFIVTYGCPLVGAPPEPKLSTEHKEIGLFTREQVSGLAMPEGYKRSIATWYRHALPADASAF